MYFPAQKRFENKIFLKFMQNIFFLKTDREKARRVGNEPRETYNKMCIHSNYCSLFYFTLPIAFHYTVH